MLLFHCPLIVTCRFCHVLRQQCTQFIGSCQKCTCLCVLVFVSLLMVDFQSSQWIFFSIDPEKMLIGLSQSVWFIPNIYVYFLDYFLWHFHLPDYFFHDLLYFCFFFFWPIRLNKLLDEIIVILRKLWANVIVNTALWLKGFNHFPFTWLDLEQINDCLNFFLAVSSAAEESCLLSHGYFFFN